MKIVAIILSIIIAITSVVAFIPTATDREWYEYLQWEQEFLNWRDSVECVYQVQDSTTGRVHFVGSLKESKAYAKDYDNVTVMPYAN